MIHAKSIHWYLGQGCHLFVGLFSHCCLIGNLNSAVIGFHSSFHWKTRRVLACLSYPKHQHICHFVTTRIKYVAWVCVTRTGTTRGSKYLFVFSTSDWCRSQRVQNLLPKECEWSNFLIFRASAAVDLNRGLSTNSPSSSLIF